MNEAGQFTLYKTEINRTCKRLFVNCTSTQFDTGTGTDNTGTRTDGAGTGTVGSGTTVLELVLKNWH